MNTNQLINMLMRMVSRRLMNWGINRASRSGGKPGQPASRQSRQMQANTKRIRQAINIARRMGR